MPMKTRLSIIVPCFNEEKNIPLIIRRFDAVKPEDLSAELILVDNGSSDRSNALIKEMMKTHDWLKLAHIKKNIGYGFGIWTGIKAASGEYICWTHADLQTDLKDTITAFNLIGLQKDSEHCFVKGKRTGRPIFDRFFTFGMSLFETLALQTWLNDINAQPNLFHKSFLTHAPNPPKDFSFDLYFYYIAKKKGYAIIRFPVGFTERIYGHSHWNTGLASKWKFIKRTVDFTIKLRKKLRK